jgi:hypothetical protein
VENVSFREKGFCGRSHPLRTHEFILGWVEPVAEAGLARLDLAHLVLFVRLVQVEHLEPVQEHLVGLPVRVVRHVSAREEHGPALRVPLRTLPPIQ